MKKGIIIPKLLIAMIINLAMYLVFFQQRNNLPPEKPSNPTGTNTIYVRKNPSCDS